MATGTVPAHKAGCRLAQAKVRVARRGWPVGAVTSNTGTYSVSAVMLVAIQITPAGVSKAVGLTQQYVAAGTYTD